MVRRLYVVCAWSGVFVAFTVVEGVLLIRGDRSAAHIVQALGTVPLTVAFVLAIRMYRDAKRARAEHHRSDPN
jgi:hypothetical protein